MIERFNFYDIYVYLIPGAVWLALLGLPFYLTVPGLEVSLAALTTIGLGGGYLSRPTASITCWRLAWPSARWLTGGSGVPIAP